LEQSFQHGGSPEARTRRNWSADSKAHSSERAGKLLDLAKAAHHTSKVLPGEFMAFSAFS
jgi:hypothetical protein